MDKRPFRFRHVHRISVAFVLTALFLVLGGVAFTGYVQKWLEPTTRYLIELPEDGTAGLEVAAQVTVLGKKVGEIEVIELRREDGETSVKPGDEISPDSIKLVAVVSVKGEFTRFIGEDSQAKLKNGLGGFGAAYLEITRGKVPRKERGHANGGKLEFVVERGVQNDVNEVLTMVKEKVGPLLDSVTATSDSVNTLVSSFTSESGSFQKTLASLRDTMEKVNSGEGALNMVLNDGDFRDDLSQTLASVDKTVSELRATATELKGSIEQFNGQTMPALNKSMEKLPEFITQAEAVMTATGEKIEALDMVGINSAVEQIESGVSDFEKTMEGLWHFPLLYPFVPKGDDKPENDAGEVDAPEVDPERIKRTPLPRRRR